MLSKTAKTQSSPEEAVYYYHNDHLGTPKVMTSQAGNVVWEAIYEPFGEIDRYLVNRIPNNFRFPGQYEDELTGLYYNHYRYYIPKLGRYNRIEPLKSQECLEYICISCSLYSYTNNNSLKYIDPEGLFSIKNCKDKTMIVAIAIQKALLKTKDKCIPCEIDKKQLFKAIDTAKIECKTTELIKYDNQLRCAQATPVKKLIELSQCAIRGGKCKGVSGGYCMFCLEATIFHEGLHLYGIYNEQKVKEIVRKCFLCAF